MRWTTIAQMIGVLLVIGSVIVPSPWIGQRLSIQVYVENLPATPTVTNWLLCPDPLRATDRVVVEFFVESQMDVVDVAYKLDQGLWCYMNSNPYGSGNWEFEYIAAKSPAEGCGLYRWGANAPQYQYFGPRQHIIYVMLKGSNGEWYDFQQAFTPTSTGTDYIEGKWISPQDGDTVSGTIDIQVVASAITKMPTSVTLLVDTDSVGDLAFVEYPSWGGGYRYGWACKWDTTTVENGAHELIVSFWIGSQLFTMSMLAYVPPAEEPWLHNPLECWQRTLMLVAGLMLLTTPLLAPGKKKKFVG